MARVLLFSVVVVAVSVVGAERSSQVSRQAVDFEPGEVGQQPVGLEDRQEGAESQEPMLEVERGKYLVHDVAMCVACHTPRNARGELDRRRLLQGAPMPVRSPFPDQEWCFRAPKIAGLPGGWSEEDLIHFLRTGEPPRGPAPRLPMPPFRLTKEDATAVVAYLKSLR